MTIEATATALVQDESTPAPAEYNEDEAMAAIYDSGDEPTEEPEATEEAEETPDVDAAPKKEAEDETKEETVEEVLSEEPPSELPLAIKKNWAAIPQEAKDALLETQRDFNRKLGDQGRLMQGISPIRDVLVDATKTMPQLAEMTPDQVAKEVFQLAQTAQEFRHNPMSTMMKLVKQHGLEQALAQHLTGQNVTQDAQQTSALTREISDLKQQLAKVTDPQYMESQFSSFSARSQTEQTVQEFASTKPDWADVEAYMPQAISFVQGMAPDASPKDVLTKAYDLALGQVKPDAIKADTKAADEAAAVVDPERSRKAQKAKAVNVNGTQTGKTKALTEDELMAAVYDKNQS